MNFEPEFLEMPIRELAKILMNFLFDLLKHKQIPVMHRSENFPKVSNPIWLTRACSTGFRRRAEDYLCQRHLPQTNFNNC